MRQIIRVPLYLYRIFVRNKKWIFFIFFYVIENVGVLLNVKCIVEKRSGKDLVTSIDIPVSTDVMNFKMDVEYTFLPTAIASLVDASICSNWKMVKSLMDPTINRCIEDTIKSFLLPFLTENPIHDVFNVETTGL